MRILAIRLKNLASLAGEQVIDLTAEPLASAGLFAITGPTGAGKSTILDALCLALFGSTPRLEGVATQGKVPDGNDEIGSKDERNLLRRGCASGYAEVDFVGVDGRRYRARWETKRARERADGRLQQSSQSLADLDDGKILASGKKREFRELLEQRLGLTLPQFTRAVLLAQTEFSAFLKADDNERGTLLEKLTDTGLYSRLGKAAFAATKQAREAQEALERQAGGQQPLTAEERQALEDDHQRAQSELRSRQQALAALKAQRQWLDERARLLGEVDSARRQLEAVEAEAQALAGARQTLALLEQLAPERHRFARQAALPPLLADLERRLVEQRERQTRLQTELQSQEDACRQAGIRLGAAEQARRDADPALIQARREEQSQARLAGEREQAGRQAEALATAVRDGEATLAGLRERQADSAGQLEQLEARLQHSAELQPLCSAWDGHRPRLQQAVQLAARLRQGETELPALETAARDAETRQQAARQALDTLQAELGGDGGLGGQLAALHEQLGQWRQQRQAGETLQRLWQNRQALADQRREIEAGQRQADTELAGLVETGRQARVERDAAEQTLQAILTLLERQRLARSERVEALRADLRPGEPCPVCGSQAHPWHSPDALLAAFAEQDEQEAGQARARLAQLDERLRSLRERHVELSALSKQSARRLETLADETRRLDDELGALPGQAALLTLPEAARADGLAQQLAELERQIEAGEQRQGRLFALQQRAEALQRDWQQAHEACLRAAARLDEQRQALQRDRAQLDEALTAYAGLLPSAILQDWQQEPARAFMQLDTRVEERRQHLARRDEMQEEQRQRQAQLAHEQLAQQHRLEQDAACQQHLAALEQQWQTCREQLRQCLGAQPDADTWQAQLETAIRLAREALATAERQLGDTRQALAGLSSTLQAEQRQRDTLHEEQAALAAHLADWRQRHPQLDDALLAELLAQDEGQAGLLRQRLDGNREALSQCRTRLEERQQRLAAHLALQLEPVDPHTLEQATADCQTQCEDSERQCTASSAALFEDDRRRQQSQALLQRIEAARAEHQRWGRISALIGSADGNAFRKIAQTYNLDLLVQHANIQLRQLARRYRLKRGGSPLGLLVLDTEMGDELRSVHSLSGGETFLVSLALALGLASMASSKLRIESLFIDEGFGSLDPESLQIAMDALDALQAQGRKVAVISHVQEMHERIPVQIQVQRLGNGQSGLRIKSG